jgi:class 3 adenylate cyclase/tetratricopeptide (TPR) repeat protein
MIFASGAVQDSKVLPIRQPTEGGAEQCGTPPNSGRMERANQASVRMRCPACSDDNPPGSSYCQSCGARLAVPCPRCGEENSPKARFCGSCGVSLIATEGERKHATVMFADVVGSTELIAGLDPEQAMERLQPAVAAMCAAVKRFDGTVVRVLGDGVMALFGAPLAQEGHALLACEAALAMQAELPRGKDTPTIRVGLHSGPVISSVMASDPTHEQGAHGLTVHLASRLQGAAEPGGICLSEDCYRLVQPYCDVRPLGCRTFKGVPESIETYSLLGLKPAVASQQFRGTNLTSFRGRERELAMLQRALGCAETGETLVVGISGLPGSGKSRLCYEFAEWCRSRLIPVFEARAQVYGHATPLQPVLEFLRLLFRISPTDDPALARNRVAQRVLSLASTFEADLPVLYDFLGIWDSKYPRPQLQPKTRHARLLDVVRHLIRHYGASTSVIIIEDLHWLDEASEDFVTTLVEAVAGTRTMLVLNYRPSYSTAWMKWPYYQELALPELSSSQIDALVQGLIGSRPELRELRQRVAERSGGNPFFAEELVRSLAENSVIVGDFGDYLVGMPIGEATLPATVQAVIGARIDRLGDGEKSVLQIGAIIGKEFPLVVLQEIAAGVLQARIEPILERLCTLNLIQEQATIDPRHFAFRHPLIQEVAYATQLRARRTTLHASVAKAMRSFYRDRLDEFAGLIAHHYEAAGQLREAADYEARAATWVGSTTPAQAIRHWTKVRGLMQNQERSKTNDALRIMASSQIAWLGWREGLTADEAKPFIAEALGWARETDDTMIPLLLFVDGRIAVASGGPADTYVERVKEALSLLPEANERGRIATLNASLSQAYGWAGLLNEALAANSAALAGLSSIKPFDHQFLGYSVEHWTMSLRGRILVRLGRFSEAQQCLDKLLGMEQTLVDPTVRFIPHLAYVDLAWCRADVRLADEHARQVAELAEKHGIPYLRVFSLACLGTARGLAGNFADAIRDFREALEVAREKRAAMEYESEILASLADCYYRTGEFGKAAAVAKDAIEIAKKRSARLPECRASITCAVALEHDGAQRPEVEALLRRAAELIRVTGASIYEPLLAEERQQLSLVTS